MFGIVSRRPRKRNFHALGMQDVSMRSFAPAIDKPMLFQIGDELPNLTDPTKFIVEGEKRYWLHISLGRDLNAGSVDVLGQQLEEVTE